MRIRKKNSSRQRRKTTKHFICNGATPQDTYGSLLDDGTIVDIVAAAQQDPQLYVFDGKQERIVSAIRVGHLLLRPGAIPAALREIVRFPESAADFGSPEQLLGDLRGCFESCGFAEDAAVQCAFFAIASWFSEVLPTPPTIVITGPGPEAAFALDRLACVVRRGISVSEFTRNAICSLPVEVKPTLLINAGDLNRGACRLLHATTLRNGVVPHNGKYLSFSRSKALYAGPACPEPTMPALQVRLSPFLGSIPLLDEAAANEVAAKFQPKLLAYRARNILNARSSTFDIPELPSSSRILARIFGAPLAGAPLLEAQLKSLLREEGEISTEERWTDFDFVVLESVIHHLHTQPGTKVFVGEIAAVANSILGLRGDLREREARAVGPVLRRFGIGILPREKRGFPVDLSPAAVDRAHRLAQQFGVLDRTPNGRCKTCNEIEDAKSAEAITREKED